MSVSVSVCTCNDKGGVCVCNASMSVMKFTEYGGVRILTVRRRGIKYIRDYCPLGLAPYKGNVSLNKMFLPSFPSAGARRRAV